MSVRERTGRRSAGRRREGNNRGERRETREERRGERREERGGEEKEDFLREEISGFGYTHAGIHVLTVCVLLNIHTHIILSYPFNLVLGHFQLQHASHVAHFNLLCTVHIYAT